MISRGFLVFLVIGLVAGVAGTETVRVVFPENTLIWIQGYVPLSVDNTVIWIPVENAVLELPEGAIIMENIHLIWQENQLGENIIIVWPS